VGCCSLRVEHVQLHAQANGCKYVVELDFLGKDSISYSNRMSVEKPVSALPCASVATPTLGSVTAWRSHRADMRPVSGVLQEGCCAGGGLERARGSLCLP
jgi:hypothetical protein